MIVGNDVPIQTQCRISSIDEVREASKEGTLEEAFGTRALFPIITHPVFK